MSYYGFPNYHHTHHFHHSHQTQQRRTLHVSSAQSAVGALRPRHAAARQTAYPHHTRRMHLAFVPQSRRTGALQRISSQSAQRPSALRTFPRSRRLGHHMGHHMVRGERPHRHGGGQRTKSRTHGRPRLARSPRSRIPIRGTCLSCRRHRHQICEPTQPLDSTRLRGRQQHCRTR